MTLSLVDLEVSLPDVLAPRARAIFLARFSFIARFKGIIDELSRELNKERSKIFNGIRIVVVFESSLI